MHQNCYKLKNKKNEYGLENSCTCTCIISSNLCQIHFRIQITKQNLRWVHLGQFQNRNAVCVIKHLSDSMGHFSCPVQGPQRGGAWWGRASAPHFESNPTPLDPAPPSPPPPTHTIFKVAPQSMKLYLLHHIIPKVESLTEQN